MQGIDIRTNPLKDMDTPIVTLTTDWSASDYYAGRVKGRLYSMIPDVRVVDINHNLPVADRITAAFVVSNACREFPAGTIHIIDAAGLRSNDDVVIVEANGQYYILLDNGLPNMVFGTTFSRAVKVEKNTVPQHGAFLAYDLYCHLAMRIAGGTDLAELGSPCTQLQQALPYSYADVEGRLKLYITYIDSYGNAYLGITHSEFENIRAGRSFELMVRQEPITTITSTQDIQKKSENVELLLTVASTGHLMLTISQATENASRLFALRVKEMLTVTFK